LVDPVPKKLVEETLENKKEKTLSKNEISKTEVPCAEAALFPLSFCRQSPDPKSEAEL
jgi:hypothetical protein